MFVAPPGPPFNSNKRHCFIEHIELYEGIANHYWRFRKPYDYTLLRKRPWCLDSLKPCQCQVLGIALFSREPWSPAFKAGLHRVALRVCVRCFWSVFFAGMIRRLRFFLWKQEVEPSLNNIFQESRKHIWIYDILCVNVRLLCRLNSCRKSEVKFQHIHNTS